MKKILAWKARVIMTLVLLSIAFYALHYAIFRDFHHIALYLIGDIGFLFLDVLVVILLIEGMLTQREKRATLNKLNMVIGTFFSEAGTELLRQFSAFIEDADGLCPELAIGPQWSKKDFEKARKAAQKFPNTVKPDPAKLAELRTFLLGRRSFLLRLLENPSLLEHERFTDLLWAVFHMADELSFRSENLEGLPSSDLTHLGHDLKRAYSHLLVEWIAYMQHLKESYPFLFSLAARTNPLNPKPSAVVT